MENDLREQPFEYEDEDTIPLVAVNPPGPPKITNKIYYAPEESQRYFADEPGNQPQDDHQRQPRFSRRQILVAGGATAGLAVATSLGIIEVKQLFQSKGHPILGSLRLGNNQQSHQQTIQPPYTTPQDLLIFSGKLSSGWSDWSWGKRQFVSSPAFTDGSAVIKFSPASWAGVYFSHKPFDTTGYGFLQFWINGGTVGGQQILVGLADSGYQFTTFVLINDYIQGGFVNLNQWQLVRIPLAAMQGADGKMGGVVIQDGSGAQQPDVFLADVRLLHLADLNEPLLLSGAAPDLNAILVFFDRLMQPDEVQTPHFYQISSLEDSSYLTPIRPTGAQYHALNKSVSLYVPHGMKDGKQYTVSVGRIHSQDGPALADASNVTVTAQALDLTVDVSKRGPAISRYIYGVNLAPSTAYMQDLRPGLNRWGGTQTTRYNWKLGNAFNAGNDYKFQNGNYGYTSFADQQPSGVVDQFIEKSKAAGVEVLVTIPTIGWVAKDDLSTSASIMPVPQGAPPIKPGSDITIFGFDPTEDRIRTSVPSRSRKGAPFADPPNLGDPSVAQDEWVYHLKNRFGSASSGYPRFYAMDNEPELWQYLERDVRPVQLSYEDTLNMFMDYATAVKDVDPSAMITAPIIWGWSNYFYSSLDRGIDNFKTKPDFHAHNDTPFLIWWMQQVHKLDQASGRRTLDVLDLHFFPQATGVFNQASTDARGKALRLRSTRSLWDKTYKDESWINDYIYLIPRMQSWIQQSYPGTKFGISEYNWGAASTMNGALAQAEVLGIFGREGVYMACYWAAPDSNSPVYNAFKLYTNFDGQGSWFDGTSVLAASTRLDTLSCYASQRENGDVLLMVLNKDDQNALTPSIHLPNLGERQVTTYLFGPDTSKPATQGDTFKLTDQTLRYTFLPYSITLLKLSKA